MCGLDRFLDYKPGVTAFWNSQYRLYSVRRRVLCSLSDIGGESSMKRLSRFGIFSLTPSKVPFGRWPPAVREIRGNLSVTSPREPVRRCSAMYGAALSEIKSIANERKLMWTKTPKLQVRLPNTGIVLCCPYAGQTTVAHILMQ